MHGVPGQGHDMGARALNVFLSAARITDRGHVLGVQDGCNWRFLKGDAVDGRSMRSGAAWEAEVEEHLKVEIRITITTNMMRPPKTCLAHSHSETVLGVVQ